MGGKKKNGRKGAKNSEPQKEEQTETSLATQEDLKQDSPEVKEEQQPQANPNNNEAAPKDETPEQKPEQVPQEQLAQPVKQSEIGELPVESNLIEATTVERLTEESPQQSKETDEPVNIAVNEGNLAGQVKEEEKAESQEKVIQKGEQQPLQTIVEAQKQELPSHLVSAEVQVLAEQEESHSPQESNLLSYSTEQNESILISQVTENQKGVEAVETVQEPIQGEESKVEPQAEVPEAAEEPEIKQEPKQSVEEVKEEQQETTIVQNTETKNSEPKQESIPEKKMEEQAKVQQQEIKTETQPQSEQVEAQPEAELVEAQPEAELVEAQPQIEEAPAKQVQIEVAPEVQRVPVVEEPLVKQQTKEKVIYEQKGGQSIDINQPIQINADQSANTKAKDVVVSAHTQDNKIFIMGESQEIMAGQATKEIVVTESVEISQESKVDGSMSFSDLNFSVNASKEIYEGKAHSSLEKEQISEKKTQNKEQVKEEVEKVVGELKTDEEKSKEIEILGEESHSEPISLENTPKQVFIEERNVVKIDVEKPQEEILLPKETSAPEELVHEKVVSEPQEAPQESLVAEKGSLEQGGKQEIKSEIGKEEIKSEIGKQEVKPEIEDVDNFKTDKLSTTAKLILSSVASVAVGGLTWSLGKSSKGGVAAGLAAFVASTAAFFFTK